MSIHNFFFTMLALVSVFLLPLTATAFEYDPCADTRGLLLAAADHAGHGSEHKMNNPPTATQMDHSRIYTTTGVFESGPEEGKATITHDPIPALNWPKMTMRFALETSDLAKGLKSGDKVRLDFKTSPDGTPRVLYMEPLR